MTESRYSTEWGIAEYEPPPSLYIVELDRNHIRILIGAAQMASVTPGISEAERDLLNEAVETLTKQTVNL
jgi:hypothetical protein